MNLKYILTYLLANKEIQANVVIRRRCKRRNKNKIDKDLMSKKLENKLASMMCLNDSSWLV